MLTRKKQVSDTFDTPHAVCCDFTKPAEIAQDEKPAEIAQVDPVSDNEQDFVVDKFGKKFPADQYFINPETGRANKIK